MHVSVCVCVHTRASVCERGHDGGSYECP